MIVHVWFYPQKRLEAQEAERLAKEKEEEEMKAQVWLSVYFINYYYIIIYIYYNASNTDVHVV